MDLTYTDASRAVVLKTTTKFVSDYNDGTSLVIYLTEDSLLGWQTDYRKPSGEQDVENFAHRHVLRDALNSAFGEPITAAPVAVGTRLANQFNYTLPASFNAEHCALVAVLYNTSTREVLQVEEIHLKH